MNPIRNGTLEYIRSDLISVPHGFTTRFGGVSTGYLESLNIALHRGDDPENVAENYRILGAALEFTAADLVMTRQTHSDLVRVVTRADCAGIDHHAYSECDGLVTGDPGVALVIFTADCTPILLHDPVTGVVGAAHAGWRGTAAAIARKTVETMVRHFGCDPANIRAAIGPNIGACCFETDSDVPEAMYAAFGEEISPYITKTGKKYHLDLKGINAHILRRAGVRQIDISTDCTACQSSRFWSHRVTGGKRGSQGAVIVCKEVTP